MCNPFTSVSSVLDFRHVPSFLALFLLLNKVLLMHAKQPVSPAMHYLTVLLSHLNWASQKVYEVELLLIYIWRSRSTSKAEEAACSRSDCHGILTAACSPNLYFRVALFMRKRMWVSYLCSYKEREMVVKLTFFPSYLRCVCARAHVQTCVKFREKLIWHLLSFHHVCFGDQTQVIRPGSKHFYALSHLPDLKFTLIYFNNLPNSTNHFSI